MRRTCNRCRVAGAASSFAASRAALTLAGEKSMSAIACRGSSRAVAAAASCYSPNKPPCAFSCVDDGLCPSGYTCQDDGICHRDDSQGICDIPPQIDAGDAGTDGPGGDADAGS